jgi:hypothetical protein
MSCTESTRASYICQFQECGRAVGNISARQACGAYRKVIANPAVYWAGLTVIRITAGLWLWIANGVIPSFTEQVVLACAAALGMAIAGVGCVRLAIALIRKREIG